MNAPLDTVYAFETPEGVDLGFRVAGPLPRALAWVIDALLRYGGLFALFLVSVSLGKLGFGIYLVVFFLVEWLYPVVFEVTRGATPGKQMLGLEVVHDNGTPVGWSASMIRNLLRVVDMFPVLYATGLICVLINRQFKRLGDLAAGTLVVYRKQVPKYTTMPDVEPLPLPTALLSDGQRALLDFAERSATLAPGRVEELAEILTGETGPQAVRKVHGYASWLARGR